MEKWTNFFDKIFVISLLHKDTDRLLKTLKQLEKFGIYVEVFAATYHENGKIGLRESMISLFHKCIDEDYSQVLILEDDVNIVADINLYMPLCLGQLPLSYDLLYLGAYIVSPFKERYSENLLLLDKALTTHAIAYPRKTIDKLLQIFERHSENPNDVTPIDITILNRVISEGKSYITYPLLISQRSGYSNIEQKEVNYDRYIEGGYNEQVKKLLG